jgi:hypothetical protein
MSFKLIEVSRQGIRGQVSAESEGFIYSHLRYYCSKFAPLPAITIRFENSEAKLVDGAEYLQISRDLERPTVRAVVIGDYAEETLKRFLSKWGGRVLDWEEIDRAERAEPLVSAWHVFFFERPLRSEEQAEFVRRIAGFFGRLAEKRGDDPSRAMSQVSFNNDQASAEFRAITPVVDESWYSHHLEICRRFSANIVKIVSYQGRRFS